MQDIERFERRMRQVSVQVDEAVKPGALTWEDMEGMHQVDMVLAFYEKRCGWPGLYKGFEVASMMCSTMMRVMKTRGVSAIPLTREILSYSHMNALIYEASSTRLGFYERCEFTRAIEHDGSDDELIASLREALNKPLFWPL